MAPEINREEMVETARRDLEKDLYLFESDRVIIEIQEVRKDESGNFVPIDEKKLTLELDENSYILIGRSIGKMGCEKHYPKRLVTTKTGKKIRVDHVYVRMGIECEDLEDLCREVRVKRLNMMGRYDVPEEERWDEMDPYQVDIYMRKKGEKRYVVIANIGHPANIIRLYYEDGKKGYPIEFGAGILLRKGRTYYVELPGAYLLEGPDYSIADKNVFLKITLS